MRSTAYIATVLLLGTVMTGCQTETAQDTVPELTKSTAPQKTSGFDVTLAEAKSELDAQMALPITVPVPKDAGGGYTHEKHKKNAMLIYNVNG